MEVLGKLVEDLKFMSSSSETSNTETRRIDKDLGKKHVIVESEEDETMIWI